MGLRLHSRSIARDLKIDVVLSRAGSNPVELLAAFINSEITYMIDQRETELAYWTTTALVAHLSSAGLTFSSRILIIFFTTLLFDSSSFDFCLR